MLDFTKAGNVALALAACAWVGLLAWLCFVELGGCQ